MSTKSPQSLLYLTVDFIAINYKKLCVVRKIVTIFGRPDVDRISFLGFSNDGSYRLPSHISELLLRKLLFHCRCNSPMDYLTLFTDPTCCPLKRFNLSNVYFKFSYDSYLSVLLPMIIKCQNLVEVDVGPAYSHLLSDTDCGTCGFSIRRLNISRYFSEQEVTKWHSRHRTFNHGFFTMNFPYLRHLSFNDCQNSITDDEIKLLASEMKCLESLDLSSTGITYACSLENLSKQLKILILHNTPLAHGDLKSLMKFSSLQHLDISWQLKETDNTDNEDNGNVKLQTFFTSGKCLQMLKSLDISGVRISDSKALQGFIENHKTLHFLGLLKVQHTLEKQAFQHLEVTSDDSLNEILACLRHYRSRADFLTQALKRLFILSQVDYLKDDVALRKIFIEIIFDLMRKYLSKDFEELQTAASACLHNFIKFDSEDGRNSLHISVLNDLVAVVIEVLQTFSSGEQILSNCSILLYNKYILSSAKFDAYQLFDLLFKVIIVLPEGHVTSIALDICAYLSSKITMEETLKLGTNENIEKLLRIIKSQVERSTAGNLLQCSLRVLWNLTDETPETCHLVMDNDGLKLTLRAMEVFDDNTHVLTKLLGVVNNLAEVHSIRSVLLCDELVSLLRNYLEMDYAIDVKYFAAGSLCNLVIFWPPNLLLNSGNQSDILSVIGNAVSRWKEVDTVLVGYRTFKSFLSLLNSPFPDVQLWAIWAIHHVCSQNVERYRKLCLHEGVVDALRKRIISDNRYDVKDLAEDALKIIVD